MTIDWDLKGWMDDETTTDDDDGDADLMPSI